MRIINKFYILLLAIKELGLWSIILLTVYKLGRITGYWKVTTSGLSKISWQEISPGRSPEEVIESFPFVFPPHEAIVKILGEKTKEVLLEAEEILNGKFRLFGGNPAEISLAPDLQPRHWEEYSDSFGKIGDIKFIWEPARFGWAYTLCRAYSLTNEDKYAEKFWEYTELFLENNPPNLGPNWVSGQEIAIRLIALTFASKIIISSPASTPERLESLLTAIYTHARRVSQTLVYARAQNNNHLLTEAAGLFTAGILFHQTTTGTRWKKTGWKWFNRAIQNQIAADGTYVQQSTNYHRLMLQTALWVRTMAQTSHQWFPSLTEEKLKLATTWLLGYLDKISGQVPNLGHNDGSNIFPLSTGVFLDYRPTIQAAGMGFLKVTLLPDGPWNEMGIWFGLPTNEYQESSVSSNPANHRLGDEQSWAILRSTNLPGRLAHADQLHVDLWWHGYNVAMDAGTYRYTDNPPWDNSLMNTAAHNTLEINRHNQMIRAGKFLWVRKAESEIIEQTATLLSASHNGYKSAGIIHKRTLRWLPDLVWEITDDIASNKAILKPIPMILHWLLPDWHWTLFEKSLRMDSPFGLMNISFLPGVEKRVELTDIQVIRAGQLLSGSGNFPPYLGWYSSTYGFKVPAISLRICVEGVPPFGLKSNFSFINSRS